MARCDRKHVNYEALTRLIEPGAPCRRALSVLAIVILSFLVSPLSAADKRNWSYTRMPEWQVNQPPEKRIGQARWDVPAGAWYFNFGPTGIRVAFDTDAPRVAKVMFVFPDSPADKKVVEGDEIIGVNGKRFSSDEPFPPGRGGASSFAIAGPRLEVAKAIEESEGDPMRKGILSFTIRRDGKTSEVNLQLERLGYFSPTFPYDCKKSRKLAEAAGDWLIKHRRGESLKWGPPRMGDWIDMPAQVALVSFGDKYKRHIEPHGSGGVMWSWIGGIRLIAAAEKQQLHNDRALIAKLGEMSNDYSKKAGPSGQYSHKTYGDHVAFRLAFAAGLNGLGQALALKCGARINEESYLRTRYLLTCTAGDKGQIGYGAASKVPLTAEDARKSVGRINPGIVRTTEEASGRLVGGSACTTLMHFVDPRDDFSEAFVKRGVRYAMSARWTARQSHGCGSLTFVFNTLAASIAPVVGEEEMFRVYMDDMKHWLNLARCHDGGWYFDPKIDTEANPYDRIHTTAAAILMLNAPLRELYVNGKGHKDPGVRAAQAEKVAKVEAKPPPPSTPPLRDARTLSLARQATLDRALLRALVELSDKGLLKSMPFPATFSGARVTLSRAENDGTLSFVGANGKTAAVSYEDLGGRDRAMMAVLVAASKPDSTDAQAMAGVYLETAGRVVAADKYFEAAGKASSEKLQKLFD